MSLGGTGRSPGARRRLEDQSHIRSGQIQTSTGSAAMADLTVADADVLDCGVCFSPLKPPIFQCDVGHMVCSPCGDKLKGAGKCHVCGIAMAGGYRRCHGMELVVESVRGPCPNAPYGCTARPAYHGREEHFLACRHTPCHCPGGKACGFVGSVAALQDHIASAHGWPCEPAAKFFTDFSVHLRLGFNFIVVPAAAADDGHDDYLFLLNVTRHPFCRAVSVVCIRPRAAAQDQEEILRFQLSYFNWTSREQVGHNLSTVFTVECSDLSDGLPDSSHCQQLIVPTGAQRDDSDDMKVTVCITTRAGSFYGSSDGEDMDSD